MPKSLIHPAPLGMDPFSGEFYAASSYSIQRGFWGPDQARRSRPSQSRIPQALLVGSLPQKERDCTRGPASMAAANKQHERTRKAAETSFVHSPKLNSAADTEGCDSETLLTDIGFVPETQEDWQQPSSCNLFMSRFGSYNDPPSSLFWEMRSAPVHGCTFNSFTT